MCIRDRDLRVYKHKFIFMQGNKIRTGQAIFSKYPIIDKGNIEFPESNNLIVYADIRKGKDTIRVYNMHLQSIKISPDVNEMQDNVDSINQHKSEVVVKRISKAFTKQQLQAEILVKHKKECSYPMIICGDMNNSAFSYVYRSIKGNPVSYTHLDVYKRQGYDSLTTEEKEFLFKAGK